ncbi:MAG: 50S ribosomal protein L25/general stress protein Ctc [Magnetovibrio sp.]|nr:50S ribosomal protein L25/general stress protein Ctc [Magnetovibrio sp.]
MTRNSTPLEAEIRNQAGKRETRKLRNSGRVPGIIYGNKLEPVLISIDPLHLNKELYKPGFFARIFEIEAAGEKHQVLARDLKLDPVTDQPTHIDFMRFSSRTILTIDVSVVFKNEEKSPGLKRGGVLNVVRHSVELKCRPDSIPETLSVDLTDLEIGDAIHISAIKLPDGVSTAITDRDFTIATIAAPTIVVEETEAEPEEDVAIDEESASEAPESPENNESKEER